MNSHDTFDTLLRTAETAGVTVIEARIITGEWGFYNLQEGLIFIQEDLVQRQKTATLAHELVHALDGHDGHQSEAVERRVNEKAAMLLITDHAYARADRLVGTDPRALAIELDTTVWAVEAWQRVAARTRVNYLRAV